MNESQTRHDLIDPALHEAGWNAPPARIAVEQQVTPGRVECDGHSNRPEKADYVLMHGNRRIAVVEAKSTEKSVDAGENQARHYAEALGVRFAYSTNGLKVRAFDLVAGTTEDFDGLRFPTPAELLARLDASAGDESDLEKVCRDIPFLPNARYYQERAVEGVIAALGSGKKNALITLATGTGKTFIAFQLVKKLAEARWCRRNGRNVIGLAKPHVLFLADRNILADQAAESFKFPENECYRLKAGTAEADIPLDRTVYFTLYQTLLGRDDDAEITEEDAREVRYKCLRPDFFDLVIIDECHRGGANDESAWRAVLEYFRSACHVGLTATPKCDINGSTYEYFGEPVYRYTLKQGILDGYLTPYRVKNFASTVRDYQYQPGDIVEGDELDEDRFYSNDELERNHIEIKERDRHFVHELFDAMPCDEKALVFCVTQQHALRITHIIREEARRRGIRAAHYCERVTAEDGAIGESFLKQFRNNENLVPTILTTSQKLSTGVDACNIRSIVLMKQVKSMVEFKQIIGRGTRLYDGKPYFTIYDFTGATEKFTDPGWDGPVTCPVCKENPCVCEPPKPRVCRKCGQIPCVCPPPPPPPPCPVCGCSPCVCPKPPKEGTKITLSRGRVLTGYWEDRIFFDDQMLTAAAFLDRFALAVRAATRTPELLRECWADMEKRKDFLETMENIGFNPDKCREVQEKTGHIDCDILDVMLDIAYDVEPVTRALRAQRAQLDAAGLTGERAFLFDAVIRNYLRDGVWTLTAESFRDLLRQRYGTLTGALHDLGFPSGEAALDFYKGIQRKIYAD